MKKYEMIPEGDMFRVRALIDIPRYRVKAGDLGGLVQGTNNLGQPGDCWLGGNAVVIQEGSVRGDAHVYENATIRDSAVVYGRAQVYGSAIVSGDAMINGPVRVYGQAKIGGYTQVDSDYPIHIAGCAQVHGNAWLVGKTVVIGDADITQGYLTNNRVIGDRLSDLIYGEYSERP